MPRIPAPRPTDVPAFAASQDLAVAKYGLPRYVHFCRRCVISNQRPNSAVEYQHTRDSRKATIAFDDEGICDACRFAQQKQATIDWKQREDELAALCDRFRSQSGYDCLVPGSGGKDSFYASHLLKTRFGMHPLTVTWAPHVHTEWGWRNFQAWIHAGFDNELTTPNGRVHRLLTRLAVENLFHPFQPFIFGQKALAPRMAILHDLPFVVYGENEAEYGNPIVDTSSARRDWSYFAASDKSQIYLGGTSIQSLYDDYGLEPQDLLPYLPADPVQIERKSIEVHYLGYYLKWHPQSCYYYAVEHGGFEASPERTPGTYSKYNSIDDRIDDFHYYTTYVKFGIGRATYDAAQEIRSGDITRDEGVALVRRYDGEFPERFAEEIFRYLSIPEKQFPQAARMFEQPVVDRDWFLRLADTFRSPHLWRRDGAQWKLRHTVFDEPEMAGPHLRLIARLDIKGPNLIKGVQLEGLRVVGDPHAHALHYYEQGADELLFIDSVASLYQRNNLSDIIKRAADRVYVPITVGGGIRSLQDVATMMLSGADKVAINTAALARPELITEVARRYGSQCMVLNVEAKRVASGRWEAYTDNGRERSGRDVVQWVTEAVDRGVGEVLLTSVDQEGTRKGFDVPLVEVICDLVRVPVTVSGGFGQASDFAALAGTGVSAVAIADALHWKRMGMAEIKAHARAAGFDVRDEVPE